MELGIVMTGIYLMGVVMFAVSSLNEPTPTQTSATHNNHPTNNDDSMKQAA